MKVRHPKSKRLYYFVDKCLPFGHSISSTLSQEFHDALAHMARFIISVNLNIEDPALINHLDDFLFQALVEQMCNAMLDQFLKMC